MKETKTIYQKVSNIKQPTDEMLAHQKSAYLQSLRQGITRKESAEAAGVCSTTVWNWRQRDKDFLIQEEAALNSRIQVVEDALFQAATTGGNSKNMVIAQIFWLKNRGKNWKDKTDVEFVMPKIVKQNYFVQAGEAPIIIEEEEVIEEVMEVDKNLSEVVKTL